MKKQIGVLAAFVLIVLGAGLVVAHSGLNNEVEDKTSMSEEFSYEEMYQYHKQMHGDDLTFEEFEEMHESCPMHNAQMGSMMSMGGMMH